ncbi:hypothetical protein [Nonomuraea sp. NPDC050691]|uniref:hypothetical protein n=1 Tax=Nonomuraea sp. NPDC050691 TaxID=3155661 RepID=UPI0033D53F17
MSVVDVERFVADGFVKVEGVAPGEVGDEARGLLWERIGLSPRERSGWRRPRFMAQTPVTLPEPLSPAGASAPARAAWGPVAAPERSAPEGAALEGAALEGAA